MVMSSWLGPVATAAEKKDIVKKRLQELRNMWQRTPQPGLWFTAGSLAQCRIFSKFLALQIKACEEGILDPNRG